MSANNEDDSNKKKFRYEPIRQTVAAVSGLGIASFAVMHLGGHLAAPISVTWANDFLFAARELYQHPVFESLLFASFAAHGVAALTKKSKTPWNLFKLTGYYLLFTVPVHIAATRLIPIAVSPDFPVDLRLVRKTMDLAGSRPIISFLFCPYYILLGTSGLFHGLSGVSKALRKFTGSAKWDAWTNRVVPRRWVFGISMAAMTAVVFSINGWLGDRDSSWLYTDTATRNAWNTLHDAMFKILSFGLL
ncbi:hypothetical protein BCR33DRAFT_855587 [Rhizoclosmatium globosum]|uniref:Mitochondrial adapter protein MCP1 transmembrane domain-containing protein n=1 Tax=Rhizoclosmatium globosum TaxID=329046 RepID=A0A1Y2BMJ7_9FUNG|nr:hypothetical protein BCR33DRAFT_855587 [Rhizoclosmatium globosum]|eukprot:ORY35979.1 hypothetical protein BCR33DRAFT_855587 [Rhizoclosmatium globosum]